MKMLASIKIDVARGRSSSVIDPRLPEHGSQYLLRDSEDARRLLHPPLHAGGPPALSTCQVLLQSLFQHMAQRLLLPRRSLFRLPEELFIQHRADLALHLSLLSTAEAGQAHPAHPPYRARRKTSRSLERRLEGTSGSVGATFTTITVSSFCSLLNRSRSSP